MGLRRFSIDASGLLSMKETLFAYSGDTEDRDDFFCTAEEEKPQSNLNSDDERTSFKSVGSSVKVSSVGGSVGRRDDNTEERGSFKSVKSNEERSTFQSFKS